MADCAGDFDIDPTGKTGFGARTRAINSSICLVGLAITVCRGELQIPTVTRVGSPADNAFWWPQH